MYEIGEQQPLLISKYTKVVEITGFNGGAMSALNTVASEEPKLIYGALSKLALVVDKGSAITRDNYVAILTKLCSITEFEENAFALLKEQLLSCPQNQLPMYTENASSIINQHNKVDFISTLSSRLGDFEKETKRKRVEKVLKKLQTISLNSR